MATNNHTPRSIEIPLTKGYVAIIDITDADLASRKWCINLSARGAYAVGSIKRENGARYNQIMHRLILSRAIGRELTSLEVVDHINGDKLDNRRKNLRLATYAENTRNSKRPRNNKTGYKGVHFIRGKWTAQITYQGRCIRLGEFSTPEQAHKAYCDAAWMYHGRFANFGTHTTVRIPIMKDDSFFVEYAKSAYDAYGAVTDHKNYQGLPMPLWDALPERIQAAWLGAVKDVFKKLQVKDSETGELYVEDKSA